MNHPGIKVTTLATPAPVHGTRTIADPPKLPGLDDRPAHEPTHHRETDPHRMQHMHTCQRDYALAATRWWMCTVGGGVSAADFDDDLLDDCDTDSGDTLTIDPADEQLWRHDNDRHQ